MNCKLQRPTYGVSCTSLKFLDLGIIYDRYPTTLAVNLCVQCVYFISFYRSRASESLSALTSIPKSFLHL